MGFWADLRPLQKQVNAHYARVNDALEKQQEDEENNMTWLYHCDQCGQTPSLMIWTSGLKYTSSDSSDYNLLDQRPNLKGFCSTACLSDYTDQVVMDTVLESREKGE